MITITDSVIQRIIRRLFRGDDYRIEIVNIIEQEHDRTSGFP